MFNTVEEFEKRIADFYGAPFAVATDCCTHSLELALRYTRATSIKVPTNTYISVPFLAKKLNLSLSWEQKEWEDHYHITNNIVDAAVYWKSKSYIPNTFMCLSFQFKKHLSLGRGGAILCNSRTAFTELKKLSYDGREPNKPWAEQNISTVGYHYYMTPETAELGLEKLEEAKYRTPKKWSWQDYPYLPGMEVFND